MNRYPSEAHTLEYVRRFIPLIGEQTNLERSYAEMLHVEGMISMAYYAQLLDTPNYRQLKVEALETYQKQVDRFEGKM